MCNDCRTKILFPFFKLFVKFDSQRFLFLFPIWLYTFWQNNIYITRRNKFFFPFYSIGSLFFQIYFKSYFNIWKVIEHNDEDLMDQIVFVFPKEHLNIQAIDYFWLDLKYVLCKAISNFWAKKIWLWRHKPVTFGAVILILKVSTLNN